MTKEDTISTQMSSISRLRLKLQEIDATLAVITDEIQDLLNLSYHLPVTDCQVTDCQVIGAMLNYGGGFVRALANAAQVADSENLKKIKHTFSQYWDEYSKMAEEDISAR